MVSLSPIRALALLACPFTAEAAHAQSVLVVDEAGGPGVDFIDIQPAVNAAGPLDRIEVRHGSYSAFTVSRPVTIIGEDPTSGGVNVPSATVMGLLAGEIAVFADIDLSNLTMVDSDGTLLFDSVESQQISIARCADVRLQSFRGFGYWTRIRSLEIEDSFVQATDLLIEPLIAGPDEDGDDAITCTRSTLYLTDCDVEGGEGGSQSLCWSGFVPEGGDALVVRSSEVRLLGTELEAGGPGLDCFGSPVGFGSDAIRFADSSNQVIASEATIQFGTSGPGTVVTEPGLPWVTVTGDTGPGEIIFFRFQAEPGSALRGFLGRRPRLQPLPGLAVPRLHSAERGVSLGATPGTGWTEVATDVPLVPIGTLIHLQSSRTLTGGATELSNSVTVVVR